MTVARTRLTNKQHGFSVALRKLFDEVHKERMKLSGKVPKYTGPKSEKPQATKGTVTCVASFVVDCPEGKQPYPTEPTGEPRGAKSQYETTTTETTPRKAHATEVGQESSQVGTYVLEARKAEHTRRRAEVLTRSTGDAKPSTHAEARVLSQVESMAKGDAGADWKSRVRSIEIHLSHSPCPSCVGLLLDLHKVLDNGMLQHAVVHWSTVYKHDVWPTTPESIRRLRGKYATLGPFPT
jgi:hypothetical protein